MRSKYNVVIYKVQNKLHTLIYIILMKDIAPCDFDFD